MNHADVISKYFQHTDRLDGVYYKNVKTRGGYIDIVCEQRDLGRWWVIECKTDMDKKGFGQLFIYRYFLSREWHIPMERIGMALVYHTPDLLIKEVYLAYGIWLLQV